VPVEGVHGHAIVLLDQGFGRQALGIGQLADERCFDGMTGLSHVF